MRIKRGLKQGLAETRKIKIGGKGKDMKSAAGNTWKKPDKFDHFKICKTAKDATDNFIVDKEIHDQIGCDEPKELKIYLPYDSVELNFPTSYQYYAGKKRMCEGDGETATEFSKDGKNKTVPCNPETCKFFNMPKGCKTSGRLHCILADAPSMGCVAVFRTHSFHSVGDITNSLDMIAENTGGVLRGLPLRLELLEKQTAEYGTIRTVSVSFAAGDLKQLREAAIDERKQRELLNIDIKMIEATAIEMGAIDDTDDPADVQGEFYPETPNIEDLALDLLESKVTPALPETTEETFEEKKARLKREAMEK